MRRDVMIFSTWNSFSSELTDALSHIIPSFTLKLLITFFLHIVPLTTLELRSFSPYDFVAENSLTRAASKGVAPIASHTMIDRGGS